MPAPRPGRRRKQCSGWNVWKIPGYKVTPSSTVVWLYAKIDVFFFDSIHLYTPGMTNIAIEHRNSGCSHWTWWFPTMFVYRRVCFLLSTLLERLRSFFLVRKCRRWLMLVEKPEIVRWRCASSGACRPEASNLTWWHTLLWHGPLRTKGTGRKWRSRKTSQHTAALTLPTSNFWKIKHIKQDGHFQLSPIKTY